MDLWAPKGPARPPDRRPGDGRAPTKPPAGWLRQGPSRPDRHPQAPRPLSAGSRLHRGFRPADPSPTPGARRHSPTVPRPHRHRLRGVRPHPAGLLPHSPPRPSLSGKVPRVKGCPPAGGRRSGGVARPVSFPQRPSGGRRCTAWLEKCVQTDHSVFHTSARPGFRPFRPEICPSRSGRQQADLGYATFMCRARRDSHPDRRARARPTSVARIGSVPRTPLAGSPAAC